MGLPGPDRAFNDGASFDLDRGVWTSMSPSTLPATAVTPVSVPTAQGLVVFRGSEGALWMPDSNTWRELPRSPGEAVEVLETSKGQLAMLYRERSGELRLAVLNANNAQWISLKSRLSGLTNAKFLAVEGKLLAVPTMPGEQGWIYDVATKSFEALANLPFRPTSIDAVISGTQVWVTGSAHPNAPIQITSLTNQWTWEAPTEISANAIDLIRIVDVDDSPIVVDGQRLWRQTALGWRTTAIDEPLGRLVSASGSVYGLRIAASGDFEIVQFRIR